MPAKPENPVLYGRYASPFVRRVAVTLRLYDIGYRHVPLMPFGPDKTELARFNPIARVPALQLADDRMYAHKRSLRGHGENRIDYGARQVRVPEAFDREMHSS